MDKLKFVRFKLGHFIVPMLLIILITGINVGVNVSAEPPEEYTEQFRLEQGSTRFYVTNLTIGDQWNINCTSIYEGVFYLFLFATRPQQSILDKEYNLVSEVVDTALALNSTPSQVPSPTNENKTVSSISLEYLITEDSLAYENPENKSLFYLEIVCIEGGPDTFQLVSSAPVESYYIPFISGFPILILVPIMSLSFWIMYRKFMKHSN